ncbi:MAG: DUF992 domain-containing protein [Pseudomonadota bacterium]
MKSAPLSAALLASAAFLLPAQAHAQSVEVGTLICSLTQDSSLIVLSSSEYACTFEASDGGLSKEYIAEFDTVGLDLTAKDEEQLGWLVLAASATDVPEKLEGTYGGVTADVALGLGAGAKILVGGSADAISLQPFSGSVQEGVGATIGLERLRLSPVN